MSGVEHRIVDSVFFSVLVGLFSCCALDDDKIHKDGDKSYDLERNNGWGRGLVVEIVCCAKTVSVGEASRLCVDKK